MRAAEHRRNKNQKERRGDREEGVNAGALIFARRQLGPADPGAVQRRAKAAIKQIRGGRNRHKHVLDVATGGGSEQHLDGG